MFKTKEEIIVIQAEAIKPLNTNVVFWSHDRGTAKLVFKLQKNQVNQTLAEGTIVPICLEFNSKTAENGRGRHIYHAVIEDAINGIVSIVLEDNILGYVGRVDGSIYIELPDTRSLDTAGRFTFDIKRSPIDLNTPELEDYYWQGFNQIMNQYHQTIAEIETESERLLNELQARILTLEEKLDDVELRARFKTAYAWSVDGTDRFTKVYPRENLLLGTLPNSWPTLEGKRSIGSAIATLGDEKVLVTATNGTPYYFAGEFSSEQVLSDEFIARIKGKRLVASVDVAFVNQLTIPTDNLDISIYYWREGGSSFKPSSRKTIAGNERIWIDALIPEDAVNVLVAIKGSGSFVSGASFEFENLKLEIVDAVPTSAPIYTPAPSEDPINAYPSYKGISIVDSDNPADYSWQAEDNTIAKKTDLTKDKVGLGNVDNYSTATQAEAEAGAATNKFMTPSLVFKAIAKWVQGKFVSATGNETILGTKNFQDGLQVKGNNVLAHKGVVIKKYSNADFPTEIASGYITLVRYGDVIQAVFNFKTRIDRDFAKDQSIIWGIAADFQADTSEGQYFGLTNTDGTTSLVKITASGATLTAHSTLTKDTWYAGTVTYLAKNKL
ncbi:BppU family phage baseplate upper protein [Enterococcus dongliensis]|uniref:BppU family phage baseplate upper protein n=1 Tax=Enterococcus dongliensis TaxID=2559925 RepID=UPI0028918BA2|nr:BppU family phage baseplate upper protein [Enterococcus dongliensis]MDT2640631.1 BppU family phage baseplate upper protein [Enterococcus dongliensis]